MPVEGTAKSKTPSIPPVYKIISANRGTKLVYNLVYSPRSKHPAPRTGANNAECFLHPAARMAKSSKMGFLKFVRAMSAQKNV